MSNQTRSIQQPQHSNSSNNNNKDHHVILFKKYKVEMVIGEGSYAKVKLATNIINGQKVNHFFFFFHILNNINLNLIIYIFNINYFIYLCYIHILCFF